MQEETDFTAWVAKESASWVAYVWVIVMSVWGGCVNYIRRRKRSADISFSVAEFFGELSIAAFAGVITYWGTLVWGISGPIAAVLISIAGLMSGHTLQIAEDAVARRMKGILGNKGE